MRVELTLRLSLGLLCCIPAAAVQSNEPTGGDAIDFGQAIALTLERNPKLIASGYQIDLSLARLQQLPIDTLKIDHSFTRSIGEKDGKPTGDGE